MNQMTTAFNQMAFVQAMCAAHRVGRMPEFAADEWKDDLDRIIALLRLSDNPMTRYIADLCAATPEPGEVMMSTFIQQWLHAGPAAGFEAALAVAVEIFENLPQGFVMRDGVQEIYDEYMSVLTDPHGEKAEGFRATVYELSLPSTVQITQAHAELMIPILRAADGKLNFTLELVARILNNATLNPVGAEEWAKELLDGRQDDLLQP